MKIVNAMKALFVICFTLGAAMSARAAGTYNLTCDAANGAKINLSLTGFTFKVTSSGSMAGEPTGAAASSGRAGNASFELTIRFGLGKDYETFLSMAQDGENLKELQADGWR